MRSKQPLEERLLDFALNTSWRYMYYTEMLFGIYCSRDFELCGKEFQVYSSGPSTGGLSKSVSRCKAVGISWRD